MTHVAYLDIKNPDCKDMSEYANHIFSLPTWDFVTTGNEDFEVR